MEMHTHQSDIPQAEMLMRQHTPVHSIIYLRSGYLKEFVAHENRPNQVVQILREGTYIGLPALFGNKTCNFSYKALSDIEVCFIEKNTFQSLVHSNIRFSNEILHSMSSDTLRNQLRILALTQKQSFGKVADTLLYLARQVYESRSFDMQLTRTELAQMIASTRENVTKTLRRLMNEGIIFLKGSYIKILQMEQLEEIAKNG